MLSEPLYFISCSFKFSFKDYRFAALVFGRPQLSLYASLINSLSSAAPRLLFLIAACLINGFTIFTHTTNPPLLCFPYSQLASFSLLTNPQSSGTPDHHTVASLAITYRCLIYEFSLFSYCLAATALPPLLSLLMDSLS